MSKSTEYRKAVQRGERPAETQYIAPEWIEPLQELAEDVCKYVPETYEINIVFLNNDALVLLSANDGFVLESPEPAGKSLAEQLNDALLVANGYIK